MSLCNHCCCGKAISIKYSECAFVVLVIQHAKPMWRNILSSVACPAVQYFSTLSHQSPAFPEKGYWTQCVCFEFYATSVWNVSHSKKNSARHHHKCTYVFKESTCYSCHILMKLVLWQIFEKHVSNFMKICPVEAEFFLVDKHHIHAWKYYMLRVQN